MKFISFTIRYWQLVITLSLLPILLYCQYIEAVIPVGSYPYALVYNSTNSKVYCANFGDNTVTVINAQNNQVIATIRVGRGPCAFAYNSTSNKVYCANRASNEVSIINGITNEVVNTVAVGAYPSALLFNSGNNTVYCANSSSNSVSVIDGVNDDVIATINVGAFPTSLAYNSTNNKVYCANTDNNTVSIIDCASNQVISTISVGQTPTSLAYNPDNNEIYCSSWSNGRIHMIDGATNQLVDSIIYGNSGPQSLIYTYGNKICYVNFTGDNIKMIDGTSDTIMATYQFPVGSRPYTILYYYGFIYCANIGSNNVYRLFYNSLSPWGTPQNTNYPVAFIATYVPNWGDRLYITNLWSSTVTVILFPFPAIEEQSLSDIKPISLTAYPNPAKSFFVIRGPLTADRQTLKMFDISGKLVKVKEFKNELRVDLKGINPGVYFLRLGDDISAKKLVVTK